MDIFTLIGLSIALTVDAFAVALAAGIVLDPFTERRWFRLAFHFGLFQAIMPVIGWLAGRGLHHWISHYYHWIAFGLLSLIGGKMIFEALKTKGKKTITKDPSKGWTLIMLSIATSVDTLAVGFSLALLEKNIFIFAIVIGVTTSVLTIAGMFLGRKLGGSWGHRIEIAGGTILCFLGIKILVEHLFFHTQI